MPSFDIVSEVEKHQLSNAVDQAGRVIDTRFDFKGVDAKFQQDGFEISITADAEFQVQQMVDMLRGTLMKCDIDPQCMELGEVALSGKLSKQTVSIKQGLDKALSKKIVKMIKDKKMKVQVTIQGEQVRVTGKKRDDLQAVMAMLRAAELEMPLQFNNFRD